MFESNNIFFTTDDVIEFNGSFYFVPIEYNILCKISRNSSDINIVGRIGEESILKKNAFSQIIEWNDEIYLIPNNCDNLVSIDLKNNKQKTILLENKQTNYKFLDSFVWNEKLIMIGCHYPAIVFYDLNNQYIEYYENIYKHYFNEKSKTNDAYFRRGHVLEGNKLYIASSLANEVVIFDLINKGYEIIKVGDNQERYDGISYDGKYYWLSSRNKPEVVRWDGKKSYKTISLPQKKDIQNGMYIEPFFEEGKIIIPALLAEKTFVLKEDGTILSSFTQKYRMIKRENNKKISSTNNGYIIIETENDKKEILCEITDGYELPDEMISRIDVMYGHGDIVKESCFFGFKELLKGFNKNEQ